MENDLIRRSDAIKVLRESIAKKPSTYSWGILSAMDTIDFIPVADAVEVKHGRWEGNYPQAMFRLKRCSACETLAPVGWYCFFCGAKMDGEEEHNGE